MQKNWTNGLPSPINRLGEIATNLWWSWHPQARELFAALDPALWRSSNHSPVRLLGTIDPLRLDEAAKNPSFLSLYESVTRAFDQEISAATQSRDSDQAATTGLVAYFSMEFAIHNSLPLYAGGLGVLAGDVCKEASDIGLPMIGVGFMYPQGYFHQHISDDGWQQEVYQQLDFDGAPIRRVLTRSGERLRVQVGLDDRIVHLAVWLVPVGRTRVYLLDTNLSENSLQDRVLSARLYTADREQRIQQEIALGIGGVRALRALGLEPSVWHGNEGHTAFMMLERIREKVRQGTPFPKALEQVKESSVFTTHTPVAAGNEVFPASLVEKYFSGFWVSLGIDQETFMALGQSGHDDSDSFSMTVLALKTARGYNAVSQLHGNVARKMWHGLWPQLTDDEVPIRSITNGIHLPTWLAPEMGALYHKYLGQDWLSKQDDSQMWQRLLHLPDEELWAVRRQLKDKLAALMREQGQRRWNGGDTPPERVIASGTLLDPNALTIGFARRFTGYKRATLLLHDQNRLLELVNNDHRPVQFVFAGKAHPADFAAKYTLHQICEVASDRRFRGRVAFLEDYDVHTAHILTQGVDVWLNTPLRRHEASGTSGMKAALNGALNLSIPDGWWREGYNGRNGWSINGALDDMAPEQQDEADSRTLYALLQEQVVPLYYDQDPQGVPHRWLEKVRESICSIAPRFSTRRMLKEYLGLLYQQHSSI